MDVSVRTRGALERLEMKLRAMETPVRAVGELLAEKMRESFAKGVDPWGQAWAPQSAATLERRRRDGKPAGWAHMAADVVMRVGEASVWVGADFDHPQQFQEGNARQPARRFVPSSGGQVVLPPQWVDEIESIFREHLDTE